MDSPPQVELSLEQQFNIRSFKSQVEQMNSEQRKDFLIMLYEQMIVKEVLYKEMLKQQWGV